MAISPFELEERLVEEVDTFESQIDDELSDKTITKGGHITIPTPKEMTATHFTILMGRYLSIGWTRMELISDRDGSFIKFVY